VASKIALTPSKHAKTPEMVAEGLGKEAGVKNRLLGLEIFARWPVFEGDL